jgi:hypothetical protein
VSDWHPTGLRTIKDVVNSLSAINLQQLPAPYYAGSSGSKGIVLAVESMNMHMTDEGWQIEAGMEHGGYRLCGYRFKESSTNLTDLYTRYLPDVVVVQDKREWDVKPGNFREPKAAFQEVDCLNHRSVVFKVTVLKDAHCHPEYHRDSAEEMGCHAWIVYYHPKIVCKLASFVRPQHLIRVYHTIDRDKVPEFQIGQRHGTILSGAISGVYPLRSRLLREAEQIPNMACLKHPGYHRNGSCTNEFLQTLSRFKVAICTSSIYGYALRKIIEATACGCHVVTDLPTDEVMPWIDGNLTRISPSTSSQEVGRITAQLCKEYDPEIQEWYAGRAKRWYDWKAAGLRLVSDIERMRANYNATVPTS